MKDSSLTSATSRQLICARCGTAFTCDLSGRCWCMDEAARLPMPDGTTDCICRACLRAEAIRAPR